MSNSRLRRLCVFCGSSPGRDPAYIQAALDLAASMAERKVDLVYGGAKVGLMGAVADAVRRGGGRVTGVIPRPLLKAEIGHEGLDEFHLVESMHERKALMASLADGFIMLPGGLGTLEEFFEAVTWNQLGLHEKPAGILNVGGYFDGVLGWMRHAVAERFVRAEHIEAILSEEEPERLLAAMEEWRMPKVEKWLDRN